MNDPKAPATRLLTDWRWFVGMCALSLLWQGALALRLGGLTPGAVALGAWLPLVLAPIWAVFSSIRVMQASLGEEGQLDQGAHAWRVVLSSLGITLLQVLAFSLLVGLGALLLFRISLGVPGLLDLLPIPSPMWFAGLLLRGYGIVLLFVLVLAALSQFAYVFSRLVDSFRGILGAWVFILAAWIGMRAVPLLADWLAWLPDFTFDEFYAVGDVYEFRTVLIESSPVAALALFFVALVGASIWILARTAADFQGQTAPAEPAGARERGL